MLMFLYVLCLFSASILSAPSWPSSRFLLPRNVTVGDTGPYTLTASTKTKAFQNHLKVTALGLGFNIGLYMSATYCPEPPSLCPQPGNETVVYSSLQLSVEVPGSQTTYTNPNGLVAYSQAHEESLPPGAVVGSFFWTPFNSSHHPGIDPECPKNNPAYDCRRGTGIITYKYNTTLGGLWACYNPNTQGGFIDTWHLFAATPDFSPDAQETPFYADAPCTELVGLVTHPWTGVVPAVWEYV